MNFVIFAIGFLLLIQGADFLVDGAINIAKRLNISNMVIGLTVVSIGTSLPELLVNVTSSMQGSNGIAVGNVIGSNIANILLILGVTATFYPLPVKKNTTFSEIPFSIAITVLLFYLANQHNFREGLFVGLSRTNGFVFLFLQVIFMYYVIQLGKFDPDEVDPTMDSEKSHLKSLINHIVDFTHTNLYYTKFLRIYYQHGWMKSTVFTILGIVLLYFGGKLTVSGASGFARDMGVSEELIALTIIAIGTSLPELITSLVAARKQNIDIAVGNVVGSLVFNILWVLGLSATISPIGMDGLSHMNIDIFILVGANVLFFVFAAFSSRYVISRMEGIIFFILYIAYIAFVIRRG
ncbi:calcium/sodium antiporter [Bacteroidota bacterium]